MTIISSYTRQQAVEDGVLIRFQDYLHEQPFCRVLLDLFSQILILSAEFDLGEVVITANAASRLDVVTAIWSLARHKTCDWGDVCEEDRLANEVALKNGDARLFSVYSQPPDIPFRIITEWNREATTVLLPEDY